MTTLEEGEGSASRPGRSLPPGKDTVPIVQDAGWAPGPVWTSAENLAPPQGFDPLTLQFAASPLYRVRYPAHIARLSSPFLPTQII